MQSDARSIGRTLAILEYFDVDHPFATVGEISRELGYPQSSSSILLKSLMTLGFLAYDEGKRAYYPTPRVALLGRAVQPQLFADGNIMAALKELSASTGELVFVAMRSGLSVHYVRVIPATNPLRLHLASGAIRPLFGSANGHLFLSGLGDQEIARLHALAVAGAAGRMVPPRAVVMKEIREIRRAGHVLSTKTSTPGGGVLGMLVSEEACDQPLAICIGGVASNIVKNAPRFIREIRRAVAWHLPAAVVQKSA